LTGAHTRVVWMRDVAENRGTRGETEDFQLMGYDSRDGRGVRAILGARGNYFRPLLTPDGRRVVFSKFGAREVWVVDFDGSNLRRVGPGIAAALWADPNTGITWVYGSDVARAGPLVRYPLDDPGQVETLWTKTPIIPVMPGNLQVSADGLKMAANLPWPVSGVAQLPDGAWAQTGRGCWPAIAPDHSYLSWTFDGRHRNLLMHDPWENRDWKVKISGAPGVDDHEVYHPRWSNHPRFMAMSGPYREGKKNKRLGGGGAGVDIHVGRFNEDFTEIEAWANVTGSDRAEFYPDVWVEGGDTYQSKFSRPGAPSPIVPPQPALADNWPGTDSGLVFLWQDNRAGNAMAQEKLGSAALAVAEGEARFGPDNEMWLQNGSVRVEGFDERMVAKIKKKEAFTVEFVLTTADREQFGPRRIITLSDGRSDLAFFAGQNFDKLVFRLRTSETGPRGHEAEIAALEPGREYHVAVSYARDVLTAYVDGRRVLISPQFPGDLGVWPEDARLLFGDEWEGVNRQWSGLLEGVAIYDRKITDEEAARKAELYRAILAARPERPVETAELELVRRHEPPDLEEISPYRRALVLNLYRVLDGSPVADENGEVRVAEWILLDGEEPEANKARQPGTRRTMRLQKFEDHPQLESERMIGEAFDLDHELYVEAFPGT
jgi:hypothetical protein